MYVRFNSAPQPKPFANGSEMALPSLICINIYASEGSTTCPHRTPGNEFNASMAPSPVPQPVTTKSAAPLLIKRAAKIPFCTYVSCAASSAAYIP